MHEVEQRDQVSGDTRVGSPVCGLKNHRQQTIDQADIGRCGQGRTQLLIGDPGTQPGQCVQSLEHVGDPAVKARTVAISRRCLGVELFKAAANLGLGGFACGDLGIAFCHPPFALRREVQVGQTPFVLQAMHQTPDGFDQRTGQRQPFEFGNFAAFGGDEETEA